MEDRFGDVERWTGIYHMTCGGSVSWCGFAKAIFERAQSLLHGSGLDLDAIAAEVGYVDGATLRTLLRGRLGRGVRELRANLR